MVRFTVLMVIMMVMPLITTGPAKSPGIATAQGFVGNKPFAPPYGATFLLDIIEGNLLIIMIIGGNLGKIIRIIVGRRRIMITMIMMILVNMIMIKT